MGDFGTAVITVKHFVETGVSDELGEFTLTASGVDMPGCRHRPLSTREAVELGYTVSETRWKSTIPTHLYDSGTLAALLALKHDDHIEVNGQDYQLDGDVKPFDDLDGAPFKATIISKKQTG